MYVLLSKLITAKIVVMVFAHAFIGVIIAFFTQPKSVTKNFRFYFWISTILGSIFPDIDVLYLIFIDNSISHRYLLTHTPLPYIFVLAILLPIVWFLKFKPIYVTIISGFFLGVFSHIFADGLMDKIYPLRPFNDFILELRPSPLNPNLTFLDGYIRSIYFAVEMAIIFCGSLILIYSFRSDKKRLTQLLMLLGIIELAAIVALIPLLN